MAQKFPQMPLSELLLGQALLSSESNCQITGLALDSRQVQTGYLFLACKGGQQHGLEYLKQAVDTGVAAIAWEPDEVWTQQRIQSQHQQLGIPLIEVPNLGGRASLIAGRFYGHPSRSLSVVGFTGTNGKTSSSLFLAQALSQWYRCGVIGTLGSGFPDELVSGTHTTPDPVELQAILARLLQAGASKISMEVSSHALDQRRVESIHFDIAVFTNLSRDHLDYHETMDAYGKSKMRLFGMPGVRCAVINLDDPFAQEILYRIPSGVRVIGYGLKPVEQLPERLDDWVWAKRISLNGSGMQVHVQTSFGGGSLHAPVLGRFNASNLLAVLAVMLHSNIALEEALKSLSGLKTVPGRMERFGGEGQPLLVVDYAHTPDAIEHALEAAREHAQGRLICVFGCGGDRDRGKRPQMGGAAERLADQIIVTDDNPRTEDGEQIIADILSGIERPKRVHVIRDRAEAIQQAVDLATGEDLVLVCGKGHEDYQIIGDQRLHFCDREQVQMALGIGQ